ncbi:MAG: hypothetical protein B6I26_08350 [Desulfobacteraceae bacterium 4572_130]|nr:MAG: hypothetical protein B6I26_08350 [Desulfobacteraceae bacterium 4572_130]
MLKKITQSEYLNLISGIILLITSGYESFAEPSIGAHHGILIFGIIQILRAIPEIVHGLKELEDAKEAKKLKQKINNIRKNEKLEF